MVIVPLSCTAGQLCPLLLDPSPPHPPPLSTPANLLNNTFSAALKPSPRSLDCQPPPPPFRHPPPQTGAINLLVAGLTFSAGLKPGGVICCIMVSSCLKRDANWRRTCCMLGRSGGSFTARSSKMEMMVSRIPRCRSSIKARICTNQAH